MRLHHEFEWDPRKAAANWNKHRVTFEEAEVVLGDDEGDVYHVEAPDDEHGVSEDRYITTGSHPTAAPCFGSAGPTARRAAGASHGSSAPGVPRTRRGYVMPRTSAASKLVRHRAGEAPAPTPEDLVRLRAGDEVPIDTSDIPEAKGPLRRLKRDAQGRLPQPLPELRDSPIRRAILAQLERRQMTRYELWQAARVHCPRLPASAVYEYLRGQRAIGLPYAEALLEAAGLVVTPRKAARPPAAARVGRK
jgi:uncharacterized DUF497 family protein